MFVTSSNNKLTESTEVNLDAIREQVVLVEGTIADRKVYFLSETELTVAALIMESQMDDDDYDDEDDSDEDVEFEDDDDWDEEDDELLETIAAANGIDMADIIIVKEGIKDNTMDMDKMMFASKEFKSYASKLKGSYTAMVKDGKVKEYVSAIKTEMGKAKTLKELNALNKIASMSTQSLNGSLAYTAGAAPAIALATTGSTLAVPLTVVGGLIAFAIFNKLDKKKTTVNLTAYIKEHKALVVYSKQCRAKIKEAKKNEKK